jgi:beta-glucosidase
MAATLAVPLGGGAATAAPAKPPDKADEPHAGWDESATVEARVNWLLSQMTLEEKVDIATGEVNDFYGFYNNGLPRLGIPALQMSDGPIGVRIADPNVFDKKATALPSALSLASTWNTELAWDYGSLMGDEAHRTNHNVQLGPSVDIARISQGARAFEALGEDPLLAGAMAAEEIKGIQSHDVMATIKHFNANNQERERSTVDAVVGERALREIYSRPFEDAVEAGAGAVMCAFNSVNQNRACNSRQLLTEILKDDLGFKGFVMSDYGATPSTVGPANNGLDQEQPGSGAGGLGQAGAKWGSNLVDAINNGSVSVVALNDKVRRILRAMIGLGLMETAPTIDPIPIRAHGRFSRQVAAEGSVLLKNDGAILPLSPEDYDKVAVIGPDADVQTFGGGSSVVPPTYSVSPLEAIQARLPNADVTYTPGVDPIGAGALLPGLPAVPSSVLRPAGGDADDHGFRAEYWTTPDWSGDADTVVNDPTADIALGIYGFRAFNANSAKLPNIGEGFIGRMSARWTGTLTAPTTGEYTFGMTSAGTGKLWIDGDLVLQNSNDAPGDADFQINEMKAQLTAGQTYEIRADYAADAGKQSSFLQGGQFRLGWAPPSGTVVPAVQAAAHAAAAADVAIVVVRNYSSEGWLDQGSLDLPNDQAGLIRKVAAANPKTIVVMMTGTPVITSTFDDHVPALVEAWFPGQEQGNAMMDVLLGDVNPSGKLPVSFPVSADKTPIQTSAQYGENGRSVYSEGVYVGYRGYDQYGIEPQYAFGHGLSYTTFEYSDLEVRQRGTVDTYAPEVRVKVTNTGSRSGSEVVQVYAGELPTSVVGTPPKQLAGFEKVDLEAGQSRTVRIALDRRSLSYWNSRLHSWITPSGNVSLMVGSSSQDIRLTGNLGVSSKDNENAPSFTGQDRYAVVNVATQNCVDAKDWGTAEGTPVQQWACPEPAKNALWRLRETPRGFYRVVNVHATGKVLAVVDGSSANGAKVELSTERGAVGQWRVLANGEGMWRLVNRQSGKCLDVTDGSLDNGARMQQWDCTAGVNQRFRIVAKK